MAVKEEFWKKMDYRKKVVRDSDGVVFCIAYESGTEGDKRLAVRETDYADYRRLYGWLHDGKASENELTMYQAELDKLVTEISLKEVSPANMVRFVDSHYNTKFCVEDFGKITIDGEEYTVSYIEDYHFNLISSKGYGTPYHICQFAEIMERNGREVKPVVPKGELTAEDIDALLTAASGKLAYWHDVFVAKHGVEGQSLGEHVKWGGEIAFIEHGRAKDFKNRLVFDYRRLMAGLRYYELITKYDSNYDPLFDKDGKFVPKTVEAYDGVIADAILQFTVFGDMKY